ncbi:hypothetical protein AgCh_018193 [Apium graveolens]
MDAMYESQSRFAHELILALGTAFKGLGADIQWPIFGEDFAYPPLDTPPSEGDDDDLSDLFLFTDLLLLEIKDLCEDLVLELWVLPPNFIKLAKDVHMPDFIAASDCVLGQRQKGVIARSVFFRPGGPLASELAKHPIILKVNDWLFCHGGLLPHHAAYGIERLNKEVSTWMRGLSESDDHGKLFFIATRGYDSVLLQLAVRPGSPESLQQLVEIARNPSSSATGLSGLVTGKEDNLRHSRDRKQTTGLSAATQEEYYLLDSVEPDPVGFCNQVFVKANKPRAYFKRFQVKFKRTRGTEEVRENKLEILTSEYEHFKSNPGEGITEVFERITAIREARDLSEISLERLYGVLKTYELEQIQQKEVYGKERMVQSSKAEENVIVAEFDPPTTNQSGDDFYSLEELEKLEDESMALIVKRFSDVRF